jgi:hypothetical protein
MPGDCFVPRKDASVFVIAMVSLTVFARSNSDVAITFSLARVYGVYTLHLCVSLQATPGAFIISRSKITAS